jgi:hypothetical protein
MQENAQLTRLKKSILCDTYLCGETPFFIICQIIFSSFPKNWLLADKPLISFQSFDTLLRHNDFHPPREEDVLADTIEDFLRQENERETKRKQFIQQLLGQRKAIDDQIAALNKMRSSVPSQGRRKCSVCGKAGHNAASHKAKGKRGRNRLRSGMASTKQ